MAEITTAVYSSATALTNAIDDLVSTGIPQEEIRSREHEGKHEVQVLSPNVTRSEIKEILQRHDPLELRETERPD
ncbi:hypothetical protein CKO25_09935 [Thiocapsa imhoffii]|uniref:Uncharacterized protein n=1 Tax=Thiocapsa imhoffii TaxID=382777 RepID=A0A9X0WIN0_9GAMM|nr:hypothetical protein [Thiocapsa imhoffii]MBK1644964.1 hypothetical protein [Thiocapsa imhoffii]